MVKQCRQGPQFSSFSKRHNKLSKLHRFAEQRFRGLKRINYDQTAQILNAKNGQTPFLIISNSGLSLLDEFSNSPVRHVQDLIPSSLANNLDILASNSKDFQGVSADKNMITMSYREFLDYTGELNLYLAQIPIFRKIEVDQLEILNDQLDKLDVIKELNQQNWTQTKLKIPPHLIEYDELTSVNMWSNKGFSDSGWHYDSYDNFLILLSGQKIVWLSNKVHDWSKWQPIWSDNYNHLKAERGYRQPRSRYVKLRQNQILFIPKGCYHRVISQQDSTALNLWFGNIKQVKLQTTDFCFRLLMNQMLEEAVKYGVKQISNYKIRKIPLEKQSYYNSVVKEGDFGRLCLRIRLRTVKMDQSMKQLENIVYFLFKYPSVSMITFLEHLMKLFQENTKTVLENLPKDCLIIIAMKMGEYMQKDQYLPKLGEICYNDFKTQQQQKLTRREDFLEKLWKLIPTDLLDTLENHLQCFRQEKLRELLESHTI